MKKHSASLQSRSLEQYCCQKEEVVKRELAALSKMVTLMQLLLKSVACKEGRRGTRHRSGRGPNPSFPCFTVSGLTFASVIIAKHAEFYDVVKGHFHLCPSVVNIMHEASSDLCSYYSQFFSFCKETFTSESDSSAFILYLNLYSFYIVFANRYFYRCWVSKL